MLLIIKPMEKTIQKDVKNPLVREETVASMLERGQVYEALEATEHERRWKDGVCDCFNNFYPGLVCSFLAPVIYTGQMLEKLTEKPKTCCKFVSISALGNIGAALIYSYSQIGGQIASGAVNVYILYMMTETRRLAREQHGIPGGACEDPLMTVCLTQCSLAQTGRKVYDYKKICDKMETCERG